MNAYAFLLRREFDGRLTFDGFFDVSAGLDADAKFVKARLTDAKLPDEMEAVAIAVKSLDLRHRYATETRGPFLVKTEEPTTYEELEQYIQAMNGSELERFMLDARF